MAPAIILFDLDGTLLVTGGASSRCILKAGQAVLGNQFHWGPITVGTLDPEIFLELANHCGIRNAAGQLEAYKACYLIELRADLAQTRGAKLMPGVREILADLRSHDNVITGLLTGNYRDAAMMKLEAAGLDPAVFAIGAFAEDGTRRPDLVRAALDHACRRLGRSCGPQNVILVGDTPRDIACARETGCHVLAVATGRYPLADLEAFGPDVAVENLADPAPLLRLVSSITDAA